MRVVLVLVLLALLVPGAEAGKKRETIVVRDYSPTHLEWYVEETVADFNAVLPRRVRLRYVDRRGTPCPDTVERGITICGGDTGARTGEVVQPKPRALILVRSGFVPIPKGSGSNLICHELMHALTGIGDNYGALPDQSCVWGYLSAPGSWDVEQLRKTFKHTRR